MKRILAAFSIVVPLTIGLARADNLPACTATGFVAQEEQSGCLVAADFGKSVITTSFLNDPTFVNTPLTQVVNNYQTTITAVLNGGATVYQETFSAPFNAVSVQNAIAVANSLLTGDGATFGPPVLTSNSMTLVSTTTSYAPTSPTLDLPTLFACNPTISNYTETCDGVSVTSTEDSSSAVDTFGPVTIMTGAGNTDEYAIPGGQEDINVNQDYTYVVDQNAVTTNTYLTTQSYEIDGTSSSTSTPEPGTFALIGCALAILALRQRTWRIGGILAAAIGLGRGGTLPVCTGIGDGGLVEEQPSCLVPNAGGTFAVTYSYLNNPTFVNTPVTQTVDDYQTTISAVLNGTTTVYQQTFDLPFNAVSVQNAITIANALLASDGATFGAPQQTSNSTTLQSSLLSSVPTSPTLDIPTLVGCVFYPASYGGSVSCDGVPVTWTLTPVDTAGPSAIMIGAGNTDQFFVGAGQTDDDLTYNYSYVVNQNAVTTNTYLITQSYEIDGTTNVSTTPEPGTFALLGGALAILALRRRARRIAYILPLAIGLAHGGSLPPCTGTSFVGQEGQSNCVVMNPGGSVVVTNSFTDDPTFVNTPVNQTIDDYQTTITGLLNGGTTVYQQTFDLPFNAVSVQNAIAIVNEMLASDGASSGSPQLTANSTTLQSSVLSYVQTSPPCDPVATGTCPGVTITPGLSSSTAFGPATIMTGQYTSDLFTVLAGQEDININTDYMYTVNQNAVTTNTYLTTQSYEIDGTTNSTSTPEPGTLALIGCGLALCVGVRRTALPQHANSLPPTDIFLGNRV